MPDKLDPDLFALAAMVRLALVEVARIKRPQDVGGELEDMRLRLVGEFANDPPEFRSAVVDAICTLMPLPIDPTKGG